MLDQRSPSIEPTRARGEVGERVCDAPNAARSLHLTEIPYHARYAHTPDHVRYSGWDDFRANCHPGRYYPASWRLADGFEADVNEIRLLLIAAHLRLDRFELLDHLPHRKATAA